MTMTKFRDFASVVESKLPTNAPYAEQCMDKLRLSLVWTARHMESCSSTSYEVLLKGSYGAAVEAVSLVSFGLVRPAVLSLRSHFELTLQYLYYRDHPVEWRSVLEYRAQPMLPGAVRKYLRENYAKFDYRFTKLARVKTRRAEDCYQILSGVAHGTAINAISSATSPVDLVESEEVVLQAVDLFHEVGEHTLDIYVSSFEGNWVSLPEGTKGELKARFGKKRPRRELQL